ncbi:lipid-A-disaccharide kinase [Nonlabens dokdonensis]|uniref:Tetraacyldisaccharide 4'-kinase n=2 Tax=Nonlabens dokdonensis TaxID=328515 RepID=L7W6F5_NONDD|nr:tetraacyldisaccharide 4'-kinase [Nonlabens dokdonensis]AGC75714.1 tetraacyldisaccharide 4'-kinase [Nonlabens dokdonensis DSW-6]PZX43401.1 lipid-A-disaccharide kinase [Nonlabens dokdonensis]
MQELRLLLYPFSILYDGITSLRNWAFDKGVLEQREFNIPIIAVGNLSIGGTGKTPMIEYLVRAHSGKKIAVLSRGYGRNTSGYLELSENDLPEKVGDEPLQIKIKFKDAIVSAVCEKRVNGIERLLSDHELDLILLDDAFQHRHVKASHYILLTSYDKLYVNDYILPAGNLRESSRGAERAKTVVVTKCPEDLSLKQRNEIESTLKLSSSQSLYFSTIQYDSLIYNDQESFALNTLEDQDVTILTGIAKPQTFVRYLSNFVDGAHLKFKDHHYFTREEIELFKTKKLIITTEKDYIRLKQYGLENVFYLPIKTKFIGKSIEL